MKKFLFLATMVCFGFIVNAQQNVNCITATLKGNNWSPSCSKNYLELKNNCNYNVNVKVKYFDKDQNKWVTETVYVYGNATNSICFNGTQYEIVSQEKAKN